MAAPSEFFSCVFYVRHWILVTWNRITTCTPFCNEKNIVFLNKNNEVHSLWDDNKIRLIVRCWECYSFHRKSMTVKFLAAGLWNIQVRLRCLSPDPICYSLLNLSNAPFEFSTRRSKILFPLEQRPGEFCIDVACVGIERVVEEVLVWIGKWTSDATV